MAEVYILGPLYRIPNQYLSKPELNSCLIIFLVALSKAAQNEPIISQLR